MSRCGLYTNPVLCSGAEGACSAVYGIENLFIVKIMGSLPLQDPYTYPQPLHRKGFALLSAFKSKRGRERYSGA